MGRAGFGERKDRVDDDLRAAARDELVDGLEVLLRPHRGAEDRELLPPDAMERRRRVRARCRAADDDPAALRGHVLRGAPGRLADMLDDDVRAAPAGRVEHGGLDVSRRVIDGDVGAELGRAARASHRSTRWRSRARRAPSRPGTPRSRRRRRCPTRAPTRLRGARPSSRACDRRSRRRAETRPPPRTTSRRGAGTRSSPAQR